MGRMNDSEASSPVLKSKERIKKQKNKKTALSALAEDVMVEITEKDEELSAETIEKLNSLIIQLRHKVPKQHFIENHAGSHVPTQDQRERFEKYIPLKKGVFTPEEDAIIVKNWKAFCKLHNWDRKDVKPFLYMRHKGKIYIEKFQERRKFVQFLADGLPDRTLYSVYHRFRNLYDFHLQRRYKPNEDEVIIAHIENNPDMDETRKFADLAKILQRTRASVWRRYRLLKKKRDKNCS